VTCPDDVYNIAMAKARRAVYLGRGARSSEPYFLEEEEYSETATHIVAPPGFGKTFYAEHQLRQFTGFRTAARSYHSRRPAPRGFRGIPVLCSPSRC
jgi:hypothetical protein